MFKRCKNLKNINLSNFNTEKVNNMNTMFKGCELLNNIDLSNFNTNNVIDMNYMFDGCKNLKKGKIITKDNKLLKKLKKF